VPFTPAGASSHEPLPIVAWRNAEPAEKRSPHHLATVKAARSRDRFEIVRRELELPSSALDAELLDIVRGCDTDLHRREQPHEKNHRFRVGDVDGVMQSPSADEDAEAGFKHGGWQPPHFDNVFAAAVTETVASSVRMLGNRCHRPHIIRTRSVITSLDGGFSPRPSVCSNSSTRT
jgi:hypothetical protein